MVWENVKSNVKEGNKTFKLKAIHQNLLYGLINHFTCIVFNGSTDRIIYPKFLIKYEYSNSNDTTMQYQQKG